MSHTIKIDNRDILEKVKVMKWICERTIIDDFPFDKGEMTTRVMQ